MGLCIEVLTDISKILFCGMKFYFCLLQILSNVVCFTFVCSSRNFYRPQKYVHAHRWDSYKFFSPINSSFLIFFAFGWVPTFCKWHCLNIFFLSRSNKKQVGLTLSVVGSDVTRNEEERRRRSDLERTSNWTERQAIITKVDSRSLFFSRRRGTPSLIHHLLDFNFWLKDAVL